MTANTSIDPATFLAEHLKQRSDQLQAGDAGGLDRGLVGVGDQALGADRDQRVQTRLDHCLSCIEGIPVFGHVPGNCERADNRTVGVAYRRDGEQDREHRPVLVDTEGLEGRAPSWGHHFRSRSRTACRCQVTGRTGAPGPSHCRAPLRTRPPATPAGRGSASSRQEPVPPAPQPCSASLTRGPAGPSSAA